MTEYNLISICSVSAIFLAFMEGLTWNPIIIASEAAANITSDSDICPTAFCIIFTLISSVESCCRESERASIEPSTSPLIIIGRLFTDPSLKPSTRSDRKNVALIRALVSEVANDARIKIIEKNPELAEEFKKENKVSLASISILDGKGKPIPTTLEKFLPGYDINSTRPAQRVADALFKNQGGKIKFNNVLGYHLEVRKNHETKLLEQEEFIHRQGTAQASRFTTAELVSIESKLTDARSKSLNIELEIYESLVKNCLQRSEKLLSIFQGISSLDVAIGFAELAHKWNYSRPEISNERIFNVVAGRHPVIEQILNKEKDASFISNNCNLSDQKIWLITGPNMGGKSTFLRQNAIINIMAQMGSFVPAEKATIGISDRIFSRVGSGDDLSRGQSTFMVEMIETASILNHATEKSFVILDEIGRGTSTWDGLSLAWSIIEKLHNDINCKTLFATHYHELTTLERSLKKLSLKTLEAKEYNDEIIFLYNLVNGSANKSYGLEVAKLAGVPFDVIKRAKDILKNLESDYKIDDKLPLFNERKEKEVVNKISKKLNEIVPDRVSPIQALEILYELKWLNKNN